MRCTYCGAFIPEGILKCPVCGREVRIVPDYNPLEDALSEEMKETMKGATRPINAQDIRRYRAGGTAGYDKATRILDRSEINAMRTRGGRTADSREREERRRRERERQKRLAKKRRQRAVLTAAAAVVLVGAVFLAAALNSYKARVGRGNKALDEKNYVKAEECFKKALAKGADKPDAYVGLARTYLLQGQTQEAESVFLSAISSQPSNEKLYRAAIEFYIETKQFNKIHELIADCEYQSVLESVAEYNSEKPSFSLPEGVYSEVQEVALSSESGEIYYTVDGTDPTTASERYTIPILVEEEGTTQIKAISVNAKGIPSLVASSRYTIELPMEDAPSVSPSTGQYDTDTKICIDVPEGYTAYYTLDNTDPSDPESYAIHYTAPVDMPEGQTIFSAVLLNNSTGKYTQVTKRNYLLEYAEE